MHALEFAIVFRFGNTELGRTDICTYTRLYPEWRQCSASRPIMQGRGLIYGRVLAYMPIWSLSTHMVGAYLGLKSFIIHTVVDEKTHRKDIETDCWITTICVYLNYTRITIVTSLMHDDCIQKTISRSRIRIISMQKYNNSFNVDLPSTLAQTV